MGLLCRPLQCDSGLLRLPLPGEAGLEILYQPQRTWFPNHPKSGFVLFFPLLFLSFSFSQAVSPSLAGFPAPPCTSQPRSHSSHCPAPCRRLRTLPGKALQSCRRACGGTQGDNPGPPSTAGAVGQPAAHPTCTSPNPIPAHPTEPVPVPKQVSSPSYLPALISAASGREGAFNL